MRKTFLATVIASTLSMSTFADFPEKDLQGVIMWGAGGSTDTVMRSIAPYAEEALGRNIILTNKAGGAGAISLKYVYASKADGYTLLMGAENPQMYKVLGLANIDYDNMVPINILARGIPVIVARNDAPYNNMAEFVAYAKAHPGEVKSGSTGPAGLPAIVLSMLKSQTDVELTDIPYQGDGPALTALQGGTIDIMSAVIGAAIEQVKAGKMKVIGLIDTESNALLPDVKPITEYYPGFNDFLPWGPFFGIFVKEGTPETAIEKLTAAYSTAAGREEFHDVMNSRGFSVMNIAGDEAKTFVDNYRSTASWIVYDAGAAKKSPEAFGIKKP